MSTSDTHQPDQDPNPGGVIWLTGFSSAGKTSLGRVVEAELGRQGTPSVFLDGDDLRSILGNKWGYSDEERRELTRVYFRLCSHIASQGFTVVISAVAMFDIAYSWFRENVPRGMLVYLDVPEEVRRTRDELAAKGVYGEGKEYGADYEVPTEPDLRLSNPDGTDLHELAREVLLKFAALSSVDSDRGRTDHWNSFYATKTAAPLSPSPFAIDVRDQLDLSAPLLLEVGCGNGRDAAFFHDGGFQVTGVDKSAAAIESCKAAHSPEIDFENGEVEDIHARPSTYDTVYSRFVLHAMTPEEEERFLAAAARTLKANGRLFVEARSIRDPLARKGEVLSPTERIHGHYRRFIVPDELAERVTAVGLTLESMIESNGLATFGDEDPVVVRLAARKPA